MAEDKIAVLCGKQVDLHPGKEAKGISFLMPKGWPANDSEVIEREELIAEIDFAMAPFRAIVDLAKKIQTKLRDDITEMFLSRKRDEREGPGLFDQPKAAPAPEPVPEKAAKTAAAEKAKKLMSKKPSKAKAAMNGAARY